MFLKSTFFVFIIITLLFAAANIRAQTEDDLDSEFLSGGTSSPGKTVSPDSPEPLTAPPDSARPGTPPGSASWEVYGYLKSDNQFSVSRDKRVSEFEAILLEAQGHVNARYGIEEFYGRAVLDVFFYPETGASDKSDTSGTRGGPGKGDDSYPHEPGVIEARELYLGGGDRFRFKLGKQLYSWGTGDAFQVTNYLDQPDMREFLATDKDDKYRGVFSLSLKYLVDDFGIEAAVSPKYNRPMLPEGYWELEFPQTGGFNVEINDQDNTSDDLGNTSFAFRGGGTIGVLDFHASYFNGISNNIVFRPQIKDLTTISMVPVYKKVQTIGADASFTIDKLAVRAEFAYTFNMPAVLDPQNGKSQTEMMALMSAPTKESPFFTYVAGADYTLWGANGMVLVEWVQGMYLKDNDKYIEPFMTDILLVRVSDKFLSERLEAEVNGLIRPVQDKPGYGVMYEVGWNFQNGLTIATGGLFFTGNEDDLFQFFDKKDMVYIEAKLEF